MRIEQQFSIFLVNKPGVLATVLGTLAGEGINVLALSLSDSGEHGVVRLVCDNAAKAREVLNNNHDRWTEAEVLAVDIADKPGSFLAIAQKLAAAGVNINYCYCTHPPGGGTCTAIFKVQDAEKAKTALHG